jgi:hypothetical protein
MPTCGRLPPFLGHAIRNESRNSGDYRKAYVAETYKSSLCSKILRLKAVYLYSAISICKSHPLASFNSQSNPLADMVHFNSLYFAGALVLSLASAVNLKRQATGNSFNLYAYSSNSNGENGKNGDSVIGGVPILYADGAVIYSHYN